MARKFSNLGQKNLDALAVWVQESIINSPIDYTAVAAYVSATNATIAFDDDRRTDESDCAESIVDGVLVNGKQVTIEELAYCLRDAIGRHIVEKLIQSDSKP